MTEYRQPRFATPAGATEFLLIRHGESAPARPGVLFDLLDDGQGDPELAPEGRRQAEAVGKRLADVEIDVAYVTTLRRTVQTAAPYLAATGKVPLVEPDLREVHLGDWEGGVFRQRVAERDPTFLRSRREQRWDAIPGAERDEVFQARVEGAIRRLAGAHPGQRLVVFTHSGVIARVLASATGAGPFAFLGCDNGSLTHLVVSGDEWTVRRYNDTTHLDGDLSRAGALPT
ncbi:histidine phosphatase family protein [Actinokineospora enzanensis]|uniref:histidine phosphatase family protein n=1 Tax=Actinokineospora enzanensis TaxID=155975 RepID=UPI00036D9F6F|nr:histidine phosphatase family protein [Actinokineospora enzanensis]